MLYVFRFFLDDFVDLFVFHAVSSHGSSPHALSGDGAIVHARGRDARFAVFAAVVHAWDVHAWEALRVRVTAFPWILFLRFDFAGAQLCLLDFLLHQARVRTARIDTWDGTTWDALRSRVAGRVVGATRVLPQVRNARLAGRVRVAVTRRAVVIRRGRRFAARVDARELRANLAFRVPIANVATVVYSWF